MRRCLVAVILSLSACATSSSSSSSTPPPKPPALSVVTQTAIADKPDTPPPAHPPTLLRGARVMTAAGDIHERGFVLLQGGYIIAVGAGDGVVPKGGLLVDVSGKTITPGLIDTHSHMGVYPTPETEGGADRSEEHTSELQSQR